IFGSYGLALSRPAALDDVSRAFGQEFEPDRAAEFARAVRRARPRGLAESTARLVQHGGGQRHPRAVDGGKSGDRRVAMAVEDPQHLALGVGAMVRSGVVDGGKNAPRLPIMSGAFDRDNPLPDRRQHFLN